LQSSRDERVEGKVSQPTPKGKISKGKADKIIRYLAFFLTSIVCIFFIVEIGILQGWLLIGLWIIGLALFTFCTIYFYRLLHKQLTKKLVGCMLLCIIFATPIYAVSATIHDQSVAQSLQNQKPIDYFKTLLGRSYNYTELIVWENQQLNFSGALRSDDPIKIYENHQGMCGEFATLYAELCISQGYRCRIVDNVFNDHAFNEVLLPNGTWIRVDASLNSTGSRAVGYPEFFVKEVGWNPPILSLAFENSSITEVTSTYSNGFMLLSPTTLIVLGSVIAFAVIAIINELLRTPKSKSTSNDDSDTESKEKITEKEEKERNQLIYDIVVRRHDQELQRTSDLDSKANNTIGFSGLLATLIGAVVGYFSKGAYSVLFAVPLSLLIVSAILGLLAYRVSTYEAIHPREFIEYYKDKTYKQTLIEYAGTIADSTIKNHRLHENKAKLIKYASALLVLAITLFFIIAVSNWLI
jgi:Flp pilus assembly protein TadB